MDQTDQTFISLDMAIDASKSTVHAMAKTGGELLFAPKAVLLNNGGKSSFHNCVKIQEKEFREEFQYYEIDMEVSEEETNLLYPNHTQSMTRSREICLFNIKTLQRLRVTGSADEKMALLQTA